jgi:translation initiation factor 3 subunit M
LTTAVVKAIVSPVASYNERSALLESIPEGATSATLKPLVTLLRIVCVGSLVEYDAFVKDSGNASMMQEKGIDAETMRRTMGLLAVCTMAANSPTATLTYTEVAAGLGIDASAEGADGVFEAEMWVVEAISEGLLDGSVDQIAGTVTVNNSVHRVFGPDQWKKLGLQVGAISANLQDVLNKVKKQADTKA